MIAARTTSNLFVLYETILENSLNLNEIKQANAELKRRTKQSNEPPIICLQETHLSRNEKIEVEVEVELFPWYGNNRQQTGRRAPKTFGGVGILVKESRFEDYTVAVCSGDVEVLALELKHCATERSDLR